MKKDTVKLHFLNPSNVGEVSDADAVGKAGSVICGAVLRVTLKVDCRHTITEARFKVAGCSFLIAACSLLTNTVVGKSTGEAALGVRSQAEITELLGVPPADRAHCPGLAGEALLSAIGNYSDSVRAEWISDEALICTCFGVSEQRIETEIRSGGLRTVAEVTNACSAGAGCGSCYKLIEDILDDFLRIV